MELIVTQAGGVQEVRSSIEDPSVSEWDAIRELDSFGTVSGERVTPKRALSIPALYQAVSMISGDVAKLPMGVWRRLEDGGRESFRGHHAFRHVNLIGMANREVNTFKFWRRLMTSALLWNNGYAWIDKNGRGEVLGLYNLLPDRTCPVRIRGELRYMTEVGGKLVYLEADEMFHLEGVSIDCFEGIELIKTFRDLLGGSLAKRKFQSKFFKNNMMAGGVLAVPPGAKPEAVRKVQAGMKEKYSSTDNAFKTIVLRDGYKWFSTQVDPQKAQLTEGTEQDAREVARMFNLKAGRLSVEGATSYNADEMAMRDYHDGTLSHWLIGIRCEANAKLRTPAETESDEIFLDYNINALQWADAKTRNEIAVSGIQHGRWSPNETRAWENMNPYEGGEVRYRPLNLEPVGSNNAGDGNSAPVPDDEVDDNEEDNRTDGSSAAERLAQAAMTRAANRVAIRKQRGKSIDDAERTALLEMLQPACEILRRDAQQELDRLIA